MKRITKKEKEVEVAASGVSTPVTRAIMLLARVAGIRP